MDPHELISLNQSNQYDFQIESPIDAPDYFFSTDDIKISKNKTKFKFDSTSLSCYVNNAFISNECIMDNQLNHSKDESKETGFNDFSVDIEDSLDGTIRYRTISFEKKENEPLGITIKNDKNDNIIVGRVIKGGLGTQFGLNEGDEIKQINLIDSNVLKSISKGRNINEISDILAKTSGKLQFLIAIKHREINFPLRSSDTELNLRALFDYDPDDDPYLPCREIGIKFKKGDILHVVDQKDPNYWQAQRECNNNNYLAGLIPSNQFQMMRNSYEVGNLTNKKSKLSIFCNKKKKKKNKNRMVTNNSAYEKVTLFHPNKKNLRPVVLIGATNGFGIFELRKMLIENVKFLSTAVPHTTRKKECNEIDGYDYHFCTQNEFETQIKENKFIEYGKYNGDYYGISISSILAVIQSSKMCLLNLNPISIEKLRNDFFWIKPYFIFIQPNNNMIDDLQQLRIVEESREIQCMYGQYFDCTITKTSLEETYCKLLDEINSLETKPKYVPTSWLSYQILNNYHHNHHNFNY